MPAQQFSGVETIQGNSFLLLFCIHSARSVGSTIFINQNLAVSNSFPVAEEAHYHLLEPAEGRTVFYEEDSSTTGNEYGEMC